MKCTHQLEIINFTFRLVNLNFFVPEISFFPDTDVSFKADYVDVDVGKVAKVQLEDGEQIDHRGSLSQCILSATEPIQTGWVTLVLHGATL